MSKYKKIVCWSLGFFLLVNFYIIPLNPDSPRVVDLISLVLLGWIVKHFFKSGINYLLSTALVILSIFPLIRLIIAFYSLDSFTQALSIRWLLALPWAYYLYKNFHKNSTHYFVLGIWWGCFVNALVVVLQFFGYTDEITQVGLASVNSTYVYFLDFFRPTGIHGHPNASNSIVSLIIPASLYLYYTQKARLYLVFLSFVILMISTQFTLTRSALIVSFLSTIIIVLGSFTNRRSLRLLLAAILIGLPIIAFMGLPGGAERWLDSSNIKNNSYDRLKTNIHAIGLILENPLGLGREDGLEKLYRISGFHAAHNAFLLNGIVFGPFFALLIFSLFLKFSTKILLNTSQVNFILLLTIHCIGLFLFEDHLLNPSFIVLAVLVSTYSLTDLFKYLQIGSHRKVNINFDRLIISHHKPEFK